MNISNSQVNRLRHFVRAGLRSLFRPEPQTAVEWADANYYLPKESAYQEGRWETLPFQEAIDAGLADELVNSTDAITVMRDALDARKSRLSGGRMTKETQSTTVSATASQADVTGVVQATEGENASAAQPDVNAQITAAVAAENSRIMGILNCEEAHGREEQACVLAETPGMTVETARRILAAAPQSAQARSDTALDRLMQGAPAPLAAGNPASDAVNDLLNTPV
ncbi:TPA: hypothetical protein JRS10_004575 [Escherichia coli]|nr:hypothetical protein [Escherichia coli]HAY3722078.1 hypothetical protein [Escherichia coli]HAY3760535.1 hypothetical protein [Escherichia coli]HAY3784015.1 hypothetical protein [Escherichia coli]HAY3788829.1 hypothetical protein [Escherichia coli]